MPQISQLKSKGNSLSLNFNQVTPGLPASWSLAPRKPLQAIIWERQVSDTGLDSPTTQVLPLPVPLLGAARPRSGGERAGLLLQPGLQPAGPPLSLARCPQSPSLLSQSSPPSAPISSDLQI